MQFFPNQLVAIFRRDKEYASYDDVEDSPEVKKERQKAHTKAIDLQDTAAADRKQVTEHEATISELHKQIDFLKKNADKLEQMSENMKSVYEIHQYQGPLDDL